MDIPAPLPWPAPSDFVHGGPVPPPAQWIRPGVVMTFNLECPGCVSGGIPFLKRLHAEFGERAEVLALHTSFGHRLLGRADVEPTPIRFAQHCSDQCTVLINTVPACLFRWRWI